jgi:serine/threonine-protein kinase
MPGSTVTDLVGRVLADRYRLLGSIGAGASGRVYIADDVRLRRRVAVKVLHTALASDAGFLRRFRTEAQLAASLHHPNIMTVHDWGEDVVPFMVMELLVGGSLRSMLDRGIRLTPGQAAYVGREVAAGLEYAHSRGLVHRDIKPANLLFDEHGITRIADFGLARALAEASWTEPAGSMLGTVRYSAPEQGTAAPLDGRSDLYSLGLVLVESVTGTVPLTADTPLGTLSLRARRGVVAPEEMGALGPVIERVGRPDPPGRYPDAATLGEALDNAMRVLPPPRPLTLAGLDDRDDPQPTQVAGTQRGPVFDQDRSATAPAELVIGSKAARRSVTRRSVAPWILLGVLLVAIGAIAYALTRPSTGAPVTVPLLEGMDAAHAQTRANAHGLLTSTVERTADDPKGSVIGQDPAPGGWLGRGGTIKLVVSKGPKPVPLPDVVGKPQASAAAALAQAQFVVGLSASYSDTVHAGLVIATQPGKQAPPGSTVTIVVSRGPRPVPVPQVPAGQPFATASRVLQRSGLVARQTPQFSDTVPVGRVIGTSPAAGAPVQKGSTVAVLVSRGPDLVVVPKLKSLTIDAATGVAERAGLSVTVSGAYSPGKKVRAQAPDTGAKVHRGTVVTLFI